MVVQRDKAVFVQAFQLNLSFSKIQQTPVEVGLTSNTRNVIVKLNSGSSSKVFEERRCGGCERKQYRGGKQSLHKGLVSVANLQDY